MTETSIRYVPEQNLYCLTWRTPIMPASSFWYFATHEEAEMAQAAMLQHEQRDSVVTTATVPERAPAGMLAVRVGSDPWTMVPLDIVTDDPECIECKALTPDTCGGCDEPVCDDCHIEHIGVRHQAAITRLDPWTMVPAWHLQEERNAESATAHRHTCTECGTQGPSCECHDYTPDWACSAECAEQANAREAENG